MANKPDDFRQAGGLARERRRKTRTALGKNAPHVSAPPARRKRANDNRRSLSGQIPKRSRVNAVTRLGLHTASWAAGRLPTAHRDRPSSISLLDVHDFEIWRG
jgi:hypothetical protein